MASNLCLSVRFLAPVFHGRRDGGEPEWPPSPMRLFQSLVNAASTRWRDVSLAPHARVSLEWLEKQTPPLVIAPKAMTTSGYRLVSAKQLNGHCGEGMVQGELFQPRGRKSRKAPYDEARTSSHAARRRRIKLCMAATGPNQR
jgi:CRISPR-associated protein Csb2